jgi:hypothetical protein
MAIIMFISQIYMAVSHVFNNNENSIVHQAISESW